MILEIDVGNSRLKWRLVRARSLALEAADEIVSSGVLVHEGRFDFSLPAAGKVDEVWVSSVLAGYESRIADWCSAEYGVAAQFAKTNKLLCNVTNSYSDVSHMGVDRWLAMVAAYNSSPGEVVIVDCGSACTIDIVLADGRHRGGYILPGFSLMKASLLSKMKRVAEPSPLPVSASPGCSTIDALDAGLLVMLVGAIEQVRQQFPGARWLFAGGDGHWLMGQVLSKLGSSVGYRACLVLDGLSIARRSLA